MNFFRLQLSLTFFTVSDHASTFCLTFFASFLHLGLRLGWGSSHLESPPQDVKLSVGRSLGAVDRPALAVGVGRGDGVVIGLGGLPLSPHALDEFHLEFVKSSSPPLTLRKPKSDRPRQHGPPRQGLILSPRPPPTLRQCPGGCLPAIIHLYMCCFLPCSNSGWCVPRA